MQALLLSNKISRHLLIISLSILLTVAFLHADNLPDTKATPSLNPFGLGADNQTSQAWDKWLPQISGLGTTEIRCLRCCWPDVEPEEGKWTRDRLDHQLSDATANHLDFTGIFVYNVAWDKKDGLNTIPVNNLSAWSTYVSEVVKHVRGRAKYFEVWNEPPNFTDDKSPADYAKLVVATYDAAKAANPDCQIGLAAQSVNVNYLDQAIKAGAKDHFDYIAVHPYEVLGGVNAGREAVYMNIVPTLRKMLATQDPARVNVPIWFTELGAAIGQEVTEKSQAQLLVKAYTMGIAQGVACLQWFECKNGDSGPMGLLDRTGKPRTAYNAMFQMVWNLGFHPAYLGWVLLNNKDYGFIFTGQRGTVMVAWAPPGITDNIIFGPHARIIDPLTGVEANSVSFPLTNAPILVLDVPENLVAQAKANKDLPFPWGGDYTSAKSVSITMGKTNTEKGLHAFSSPTLVTDTTPYGDAARSGDVPGGNTFVVDPNFLTYTTTPIEITVVVRRDPANDNAGFNLKYESTSGTKGGGGWYTVPDDKEWHTKTWKITDPQFVAKWGYNFTLDSDGHQYDKYYIQSVTVTKLDPVSATSEADR